VTVPSVPRRGPAAGRGVPGPRLNPGCLWAAAGGALGLTVLVTAVVLGRLRGVSWSASHPAEPVLTLIPLPSATAAIALEPTLQGSPAPTASPEPTLPQVPLSLGALVEVARTEGDGLRLRERPGLEAPIKFLGLESEVFQLQEGPVEQDGFTWWLLENPYDAAKFGWAVGDFLRVLSR